MRIFFILFMFCFFVYGGKFASAQKPLKGLKSAAKVAVPKTPKIPKVKVSVPKVNIPLVRFSSSYFTSYKLDGLKRYYESMPQETVEQLLNRNHLSGKEALEIQQQIFYGTWEDESKKMWLLNNVPALPLTQGIALVPSFQKQAVKSYLQVLKKYAGASSFAKRGDLDAWGEVMAAVSDLGLLGESEDAASLVKIYQQVPAPAKQVTALAIMRSLLSLNATEEMASFAQIAAKDGVLTEEFSLGMDNNVDAWVPPSEKDLGRMYEAATRFQPVTALHFDLSADATARWMAFKNDVQKATPSLDLSGYAPRMEQQIRETTPEELQAMLSGESNPIFEGMETEAVQNLITFAKLEWVRRFSLENPLLAKYASPEELTQWADYTQYKEPQKVLQHLLKQRQTQQFARLTDKMNEYSRFLADCFQVSRDEFESVYAEFKQLSKQYPEYDWGNLTERFQELSLNRFKEAKAYFANVQDKTVFKEEELRKLGNIFANFQRFNPHFSIITDSSRQFVTKRLLQNKNLTFLKEEGLLDVFLYQQEMYYRSKLGYPVYRAFLNEQEFTELKQDFERLQAKTPDYNWKDVEDLFVSRFKEHVMLKKQRSEVVNVEYFSVAEIREDFEKITKLQESYPNFWPESDQIFAKKLKQVLANSFRHREADNYFGDHYRELKYDNTFLTARNSYRRSVNSAVNSFQPSKFPPNWTALEQELPARQLEFRSQIDTLLKDLKEELERKQAAARSASAAKLSTPPAEKKDASSVVNTGIKQETVPPEELPEVPAANTISTPQLNTLSSSEVLHPESLLLSPVENTGSGSGSLSSMLQESLQGQKKPVQKEGFFSRLKKWFLKRNK